MLILSVIGLVWANGQSSHLWISTRAIEHLPTGELKQLLQDPTVEQQWRNGTMFQMVGMLSMMIMERSLIGSLFKWRIWIGFESASPPWSVEAETHRFSQGLGVPWVGRPII